MLETHYSGTIFCYFGYMDHNGPNLPLEFAYPPFQFFFTEKLLKTEASKLYHAKAHKILCRK